MTNSIAENSLALADWRRRTAETYALIRQNDNPLLAWQLYISQRNQLMKYHPQSPLDPDQRSVFQQLPYYAYEPALRVMGNLDYGVEAVDMTIDLADDGLLKLRRVAVIRLEVAGQAPQLNLFWVQGYGGGLFLPFRDQTNQTETYSGGRYLYDTIKGADLGAKKEDEILLDFNFAYNPSCAYNPRWVCPLAPQENNLPVAITAGEKRFLIGHGE